MWSKAGRFRQVDHDYDDGDDSHVYGAFIANVHPDYLMNGDSAVNSR